MNIEKLKQKFVNETIIPTNNYKQPFIIALNGYSGSGKTHVACLLSKALGIYIIGDDFVRNYLWIKKIANDCETINNLTYEITSARINKLLDANVPIILDSSISSKEHLENLKKLGVDIILIKLNSTHEENLKRLKAKLKDPDLINPNEIVGDYIRTTSMADPKAYDLVKNRKIYDLKDEAFNYHIDTLQGLDYVKNEVKKIAEDIKEKYN